MPIRPEMRALYPPEWPLISDYIRFDRAMGRCECDGRCGGRYCRARLGITERCPNYHGDANRWTGSKVVLTTMHLDHDPTNCDPANLMAGCQACHLAYDAIHHAVTAAETREAKKRKRDNQMTIDDVTPDDPEPVTRTLPKVPQFANDGDAIAWLGVDAERWTAAFLHSADLANAGPDFVHTVFGWFCNAIGAGQSSVQQVPDRDSWFTDAVNIETVIRPDGWLVLNMREGEPPNQRVASVTFDKPFGKATHAALTKWLYPGATVLPTLLEEFANALRGDWTSQDGRGLKRALDELVGWMRDPTTAPDLALMRDRLGMCPAGAGHWSGHCDDDIHAEQQYVGTRPGIACPNCKGERYDGKYCLDCGYRPPFATAASSEEGKP